MTDPAHLSQQEQNELVAYLDGELSGDAARRMEAKLSLNPAIRAEAEALRRTWDLLDFLPKPQPSARFTHRTMERLTPLQAEEQRRRNRRRTCFFGLGWAAALLLAGWSGFAGYNWFVPREPGDRELLRDLRIIENKRTYDRMEDLDFWRALDSSDLFGDEASNS